MAYVRLSAGVYQDQATGQIIRPPGGRLPPGAKLAAGLPASVVGQGMPPRFGGAPLPQSNIDPGRIPGNVKTLPGSYQLKPGESLPQAIGNSGIASAQEQALQAIQPQGPGYSPMVQSQNYRLAAPWNDPSQYAGQKDDRPGALMAFGRGKPGYMPQARQPIDPSRIPGTKYYKG